MRSAFLFLLVALASGGVARGQADPNNAARHYRSAFDRYEAMPERDWDPIWAYFNDPGVDPPAGLRTVLSRAAPMFADFERASRKRDVDWHLDYELGYDMQLPHLSPMRGIAKALRARIVLALHDGNAGDAAEGIATLYRVAAHARSDRTLISSLVAQAIYNLADELAQIGLDHVAFDAAAAHRLIRGHSLLDGPDPFLTVEAIAMEQELSASWLEAKLGTVELREEAGSIEWLQLDENQVLDFASMTDKDFEEQIADYDALMETVVDAFANPDAEAGRVQLQAMEETIEAGELSVMITVLMPAFTKVFDRTAEVDAKVADRTALYRGLAQGLIDPQEHANAVPFYLKAIESLDEFGAEALESLREQDDDPRRAVDERLAALLERADEVLDFVREGAKLDRCDFEFVRPRNRVRLCPAYVAGLRDVVRLLHVRTRRAHGLGDTAAVIEHLHLGYRLSAHLALDGFFLDSSLAHETFKRTHALAEPIVAAGMMDENARHRLYRIADGIARSDPFGYRAATDRLRKTVSSSYYFWWSRNDEDTAFRAVIDTWDADQLLFVVSVCDTVVRQGMTTDKDEREAVVVAEPGDLARVLDLLDADQLAAAIAQAPEVHERLRGHDAAIFENQIRPIPGQLELRRSRARADLRMGMALLRPRSSRE